VTQIDKQERVRLKEAVMAAQEAIREIFPLKQRVAMAPIPIRAAYITVLNHWCSRAATPKADVINPTQLATLVELDAIIEQKKGLGCYPFSADETSFLVRSANSDKVYAFCALDALAIPRLLGQSARIEVRCASCGHALYCEVAANGALPKQTLDHMVMTWEQGSLIDAGSQACHRMLCPHIHFMCTDCAGWSQAHIFTLPQAMIIANTFFAFQLDLVTRPC